MAGGGAGRCGKHKHSRSGVSRSGGRVHADHVVVPELEAALKELAAKGPRPWTPREEAILIRYYRYGMVNYIARYLGRSVSSVYNKAKRMGLRCGSGHVPSDGPAESKGGGQNG